MEIIHLKLKNSLSFIFKFVENMVNIENMKILLMFYQLQIERIEAIFFYLMYQLVNIKLYVVNCRELNEIFI